MQVWESVGKMSKLQFFLVYIYISFKRIGKGGYMIKIIEGAGVVTTSTPPPLLPTKKLQAKIKLAGGGDEKDLPQCYRVRCQNLIK